MASLDIVPAGFDHANFYGGDMVAGTLAHFEADGTTPRPVAGSTFTLRLYKKNKPADVVVEFVLDTGDAGAGIIGFSADLAAFDGSGRGNLVFEYRNETAARTVFTVPATIHRRGEGTTPSGQVQDRTIAVTYVDADTFTLALSHGGAAAGLGVPAGGTTGESLVKVSDTDFDTGWAAGGVSDHGDLDGLDGDDHPHYLTEARGDARYPLGASIPAELVDLDTTVTGAELDAMSTKLAGVDVNAADDQTADEVPVTPSGNLSASDVEAALFELQGDIDALAQLTAGNTVVGDYSGSVPGNGVGDNGDFAIDVSDGQVYGPKAAGVWPATPVGDFITATNLSFSRNATSVTVESDAGTDTTLPAATTSNAGVMAAADKTQLGTNTTDIGTNTTAIGTKLATTTHTAHLTDAAGHPVATGSVAGFMSAADKTKLGGLFTPDSPPLAKSASTAYWAVPGLTAVNGQNTSYSANRIEYEAFTVIGGSITVTDVMFWVMTAASAGATGKIAIYRANEFWQPTALLFLSGSLATDVTGERAQGGVATVLAPGRYVKATNFSASPTMRYCEMTGVNLGHDTTDWGKSIVNMRISSQPYAAFGADPGVHWDTVGTFSAAPRHIVGMKWTRT